MIRFEPINVGTTTVEFSAGPKALLQKPSPVTTH